MKFRCSNRIAFMTTGIVACLLLSGCAWSIDGGGHKPGTVIKQPTRGQELIDLKTAKDQGAITGEEYQAEKKKIMER